MRELKILRVLSPNDPGGGDPAYVANWQNLPPFDVARVNLQYDVSADITAIQNMVAAGIGWMRYYAIIDYPFSGLNFGGLSPPFATWHNWFRDNIQFAGGSGAASRHRFRVANKVGLFSYYGLPAEARELIPWKLIPATGTGSRQAIADEMKLLSENPGGTAIASAGIQLDQAWLDLSDFWFARGSDDPGCPASRTNACQSGSTSTTVKFDTGASGTDDFYNGLRVRVTDPATGATESRNVTDYVGSTKVATVSSTWTRTPASGDPYQVGTACADFVSGHGETNASTPGFPNLAVGQANAYIASLSTYATPSNTWGDHTTSILDFYNRIDSTLSAGRFAWKNGEHRTVNGSTIPYPWMLEDAWNNVIDGADQAARWAQAKTLHVAHPENMLLIKLYGGVDNYTVGLQEALDHWRAVGGWIGFTDDGNNAASPTAIQNREAAYLATALARQGARSSTVICT